MGETPNEIPPVGEAGDHPPFFMLPEMELVLLTHTILEKYIGY